MKRIALATLLCSLTAHAGTVEVRDHVGALPLAAVDRLRDVAERYPFDLRVLVENSGKGALRDAVHAWTDRPGVVVVGIDPEHHGTTVHFGAGVGVPARDFDPISRAGNPQFKAGDFAGGIQSIADASARSAEHAREMAAGRVVVVPSTPFPEPREAVPTGLVVFLLLAAAALVGAFVWWWTRRQGERLDQNLESFREAKERIDERNATEEDWHRRMKTRMAAPASPPPPPPARSVVRTYAPPPSVVHHHHDHGSGDLLTGMAIGNMMGHHSAPTVHVHTPAPAPSYSAPTSDSGGSSSGWSSWSSSDSGGSSSSWDSGGSSSSDSGGGSSDW